MTAWTEAEVTLIRDTSLSYEDVSRITGRTLGTVRSRASILGVPRNAPCVRWSEAEVALLHDTSLTLIEVSECTGRPYKAVQLRASRLGIKRKPVWTEAELAILADTSLSLAEVADRTGHPLGTVSSQALRRGIWRGARAGDEHYRWTEERNKSWRGEDWPEVRLVALERDGYACQACGFFEPEGTDLNVHHLIPWRLRPVNDLEWLTTLCRPCHLQRPEHWWEEIPEELLAIPLGHPMV